MKKWQISVIFVILAVLIIGTVSASMPISIGGGWIDYSIPAGSAPVSSTDNPFTYFSEGPSHIMITDMYCVGDVPAVYEGGVKLGEGNPVTSTSPVCQPWTATPDVAYAGEWSHACINMAPGRHSFDIVNTQMYADDAADGGKVKVESGICPDTPEAPEFPSLALPIGMILGLVFIVYSLQTRKE